MSVYSRKSRVENDRFRSVGRSLTLSLTLSLACLLYFSITILGFIYIYVRACVRACVCVKKHSHCYGLRGLVRFGMLGNRNKVRALSDIPLDCLDYLPSNVANLPCGSNWLAIPIRHWRGKPTAESCRHRTNPKPMHHSIRMPWTCLSHSPPYRSFPGRWLWPPLP